MLQPHNDMHDSRYSNDGKHATRHDWSPVLNDWELRYRKCLTESCVCRQANTITLRVAPLSMQPNKQFEFCMRVTIFGFRFQW